MESISKKGKIFHGKFAETAVKIGLATPLEGGSETKPKAPKKEKVVKAPKAPKAPKTPKNKK